MASPEISVVIPAFERVSALEGCLHALVAQTLEPSRFEVIICDDGSRQPLITRLAPILGGLEKELTIRIISQPNSGPAAARNRAAASAAGRYLAFTDDDCRPEPEWLERLLGHFTAKPDALIGGGMRTSPESDRYAHATQAIMNFVYAEQDRRQGMRVFSTSNLALPAQAFRELGGFSSAFRRAAGEDYDLCARWYSGGGEVIYAPDAVVVHDHALNFGRYWLQHFTYGRGLLTMRQRLRRRGARMRANELPGSFYIRLIASPVRRAGPRGLERAMLVALAQLATAAGGFAELMNPTAAALPVMELTPAESPSDA